MKTVFAKFVAPVLLIGAVALPIVAQAQAPVNMSVHARLQRQHNRIHAGVANGTLTRGQAARLHVRDAAIHNRAMADRSMNGGKLTVGEHRRMEGRLNRTSGAIYRKKHSM